jgi:tRNA A-37 threonylcarbamoyl transferase component Bud32
MDAFNPSLDDLNTMEYYRKECSANEIRLHKIAADMGFAPPVYETDDETYMVMEKLEAMNLADMYGPKIRNLPHYLKRNIVDILEALYAEAGIQYVDITPYNFIEDNNKTWIIDFGDAYDNDLKLHPHLHRIFKTKVLRWNPDFE